MPGICRVEILRRASASPAPPQDDGAEISVTHWVCILIGSDSDAPTMAQACAALDEAGVAYEMKVASAHRSPERTKQVVTDAERDGAGVFIAGAGMAAHLPGVVASFTTKPVIGVPLAGSALQGFDALLAIAQMPPGIPVATVAVGGARNAGILATQILALEDSALATRLKEQRSKMAASVAEKSKQVERSTR
jgi:phosphoribosylaminoimidazole carboxylase PurE protein